ncbi:IS1595 family transposase [Pseudodesulfovibrio tunisiensis]|uniref:IS1595 family transposase n=1 Tax=Pseudodesulfovibrio tunisiensis TaxID=463192 RepID=UPI001FB53F5D|nr:IS1595 family transposase [Pseudodesulfovibrio tunisiensis]
MEAARCEYDPAIVGNAVPAFAEQQYPNNIKALLRNEQRAREFLLAHCWPGGEPYCPRCGNRKIYTLSGQRLRCSSCKYTFQPFSGRWINNGALSCTEWIGLTRLFMQERTVHQMKQDLGLSYNTVYKALTALRFAILAHAPDATQLMGPETGLNSYLKGTRLTGGPKDMRMDTIPVYGILHRDGLVFIDLVPGFQAETVFHFHMNFRLKLVRAGNLVYTDRYKDYDALVFCGNESLPYEIIRRHDEPPMIDARNDSFWRFARGRLKKFRGISCQRFPLYLKELEFRYNNRESQIFEALVSRLCALVPDLGAKTG